MASTSAPRSRTRSRLITAFLAMLGIIGVLILVVGGYGIWSVQRAFPQTDGSLQVSGFEHEVTVQRDARGIPTITAETSHDLFMAQGYVHAQDRFWEMDFRRHMTAGRLAELFGESQLGADKFLRSLDWHGIAAQEIAALPQRERAYYEAYADGVNAYLAERQGGALALEYTVLGLQNPGYEPEPWTPVDSAAWLKAMAWDLRTNLEQETARALLTQQLDADRLADLYPPYPFDKHPVILAEDPDGSELPAADIPTRTGLNEPANTDARPRAVTTNPAPELQLAGLTEALATLEQAMPSAGEGIGSNSWVVSGEHTESGLPLLANDLHLGASLPSVWHQVQLRCATITEDCAYDVSGFSFSGLPGVVVGHNQNIAWGFTHLTTDVADLYVEKIQDDGYWHDGELVPLEIRQETFKVAGGQDVHHEVRATRHGPILSDAEPDFATITRDPPIADDAPPGEYALSLRWTALDVTTTPRAIFTLNRAQNFADFRQAAYEFAVPAQNLVYADVEGNIGYQTPGKLPIRGAGDGYLPQPGWDSSYNWQGFIPFDELPVSYNPDSGYIVTANNAIVTNDYPYLLSRDWDYGHRAARIVEQLEALIAEAPVTRESMSQLQMDTFFPTAAPLQQAYASIKVDNDDVQQALDMLVEWDGHNDADSAPAAYANVLWHHVTLAMVQTQEANIRRTDQSRFTEFFIAQLDDPDSTWWGDSQEALLAGAALAAYDELVEAQGSDPEQWNWGELHALWPTHETFGASGIGLIEALFNRGPYPTGGGPGVVNATGWDMEYSYVTTTVPSMRLVADLSDWDQSVWQNLTGTSGHAFHPNYVDQADDWAQGNQLPWAYSPEAIDDAAEAVLVLEPTG